jgi:hypothetical protein
MWREELVDLWSKVESSLAIEEFGVTGSLSPIPMPIVRFITEN